MKYITRCSVKSCTSYKEQLDKKERIRLVSKESILFSQSRNLVAQSFAHSQNKKYCHKITGSV